MIMKRKYVIIVLIILTIWIVWYEIQFNTFLKRYDIFYDGGKLRFVGSGHSKFDITIYGVDITGYKNSDIRLNFNNLDIPINDISREQIKELLDAQPDIGYEINTDGTIAIGTKYLNGYLIHDFTIYLTDEEFTVSVSLEHNKTNTNQCILIMPDKPTIGIPIKRSELIKKMGKPEEQSITREFP